MVLQSSVGQLIVSCWRPWSTPDEISALVYGLGRSMSQDLEKGKVASLPAMQAGLYQLALQSCCYRGAVEYTKIISTVDAVPVPLYRISCGSHPHGLPVLMACLSDISSSKGHRHFM